MRSTITRAAAAAALAGAFTAAGGAAAEGWTAIRNAASGRGTMVCPLDDADTGNLFCFGLRCQAGQPMLWTVFLAGGELPSKGEITVSVDGAAVGSLVFKTTVAEGIQAGNAPYSAVRHAAIAEALKRGKRAVLTVRGLPRPVAISLEGAAKQIQRTFRLCKVPEGAPSQPMGVPSGETRDHG
jgi:hypothetical protein